MEINLACNDESPLTSGLRFAFLLLSGVATPPFARRGVSHRIDSRGDLQFQLHRSTSPVLPVIFSAVGRLRVRPPCPIHDDGLPQSSMVTIAECNWPASLLLLAHTSSVLSHLCDDDQTLENIRRRPNDLYPLPPHPREIPRPFLNRAKRVAFLIDLIRGKLFLNIPSMRNRYDPIVRIAQIGSRP